MTPRQSPHTYVFLGPRRAGPQRTQSGQAWSRLLCLIVLAGLAMMTGLALPRALAQSVDPQSLVGEWVGTWTMGSEAAVKADYNMTITKVEGNQVHGRVERAGWGRTVPSEFDFVGTLEGDKLVLADSTHPGELTIYKTNYGTQMKGTSVESIRFNISMTKKK
jgi:hypothetical protein